MVSENMENFLNDFSIEVTPNAAKKINQFSDYLSPGTLVYIAHIEGTPIEETVDTAKKITNQGFKAMPHFPARIIKDRNMLGDWIARYQNEAGVENALLIAGGANKPYGDFDSSIQLIESELFDKAEFKKLHIAGHPEGSKEIDPDGSTTNVDEALSWKNEFSKRTDASMAITTQFCFDAQTIINWAESLIEMNIDLFGLYSYNSIIVSEIKKKMNDDIRILFTEYRQKRKGNFNSNIRRISNLDGNDK